MSNDTPLTAHNPSFAGPHGRAHWSQQQRMGDPGLKLLISTLAYYSDEAWSCFPGQALLARDTEQSLSTIKRQIKLLIRLGLVRRVARFVGKANRATDRYYLNSWLVVSAERVKAYRDDPTLGAEALSTGSATRGQADPLLDETAGQEQGVILTSGHNKGSELDRVTTYKNYLTQVGRDPHQVEDHEQTDVPASMPEALRALARKGRGARGLRVPPGLDRPGRKVLPAGSNPFVTRDSSPELEHTLHT